MVAVQKQSTAVEPKQSTAVAQKQSTVAALKRFMAVVARQFMAAVQKQSTAVVARQFMAAVQKQSTAVVQKQSTAVVQKQSTAVVQKQSMAVVHNLLSGPIEQIDRVDGTFVSVGQTVTFAGDRFVSLRVGDFVNVFGSISGAGTIEASDVGISSDLYVPGATEVSVTGIPSSVDFLNGTARIGGLTVDYTPSLGGSDFGGIGAAITVIGTQPALGGAMLGESVIDMTRLFFRD
jgi:hypothetical protein